MNEIVNLLDIPLFLLPFIVVYLLIKRTLIWHNRFALFKEEFNYQIREIHSLILLNGWEWAILKLRYVKIFQESSWCIFSKSQRKFLENKISELYRPIAEKNDKQFEKTMAELCAEIELFCLHPFRQIGRCFAEYAKTLFGVHSCKTYKSDSSDSLK